MSRIRKAARREAVTNLQGRDGRGYAKVWVTKVLYVNGLLGWVNTALTGAALTCASARQDRRNGIRRASLISGVKVAALTLT
jgi:hypothetical protein